MPQPSHVSTLHKGLQYNSLRCIRKTSLAELYLTPANIILSNMQILTTPHSHNLKTIDK